MEPVTLMEQIRQEASRRVVAEGNYVGVNGFIEKLVEISIQVWLEYFPAICREICRINHEQQRLMREISNKGKYTDSYGWSDKHEFHFEYQYTPEFYFFFTNYVYSDFFGNDNKPTYRKFMGRILRGDDPIETLIWAKKIYGSNTQKQLVTVS